jgi:hypothetical protein
MSSEENKDDLGVIIEVDEEFNKLEYGAKDGRGGWKPDISALLDVVQEGIWTAGPGTRIVIQYPENWRDTREWIITKSLGETSFIMWDPFMGQCGTTDWRTGTAQGYLFKLPDPKGQWRRGPAVKKKKEKGKKDE